MKPYVSYILIVLFFFPLWISAQVFPVQANPQVIPPYSLKLSEYGTASSEKLILNLLLTDITESNRQVRLKLLIENNAGLSIQNNDIVIGANPIFLDGGVPLRLSNLDLQPYFSLQNLIGIAPQQYSTPLPEGLYRFCFEVYDALSGQQISRKSCVPVYLVLNDPPFLNLPVRGEQVLMREPQNIIFQWTPRHLNATNVSYEFTLTELWDNQMDPQAAFLAGRPLYQTTTFATTLLYGPAETQLLPDKRYGWRVRATVSDGISETSVFKNDGYSEIYYFTHTGSCAEPKTIISEATNKTTEKIYWEGVDHLSYDIQYRKKNTGDTNQTNIWFNEESLYEYTTIYNLEPGETYEFRVGGQCIENGPFAYSQISEFTMPIENSDTASYNCGIRPPDIDIDNQEPLTNIITNEVFTAGDFPVTVKEIVAGNVRYLIPDEKTEEQIEKEEEENRGVPVVEESTDGKGIFSGWGYIVVPYLNDTKIKVSFEGIKINTDYQLIEGIVKTDYDKNWGGLTSINDVLDPFEGDNDLEQINLNFDIVEGDISTSPDGSVLVKNPISNDVITVHSGGDDIIIIDKSGDIFHVDTEGNIRQGGQLAQGGAINAENTAGLDSNGDVIQLTEKGIKVTFMDASDYTFGFDWIPKGMEQQLGQHYKQIKDVERIPYNIVNKAIGNGKDDIIKAKVTISDNTLSINDLVIKTEHGENIPYQNLGNGIISVKISGYYTFEYQNIYATIQPKKNKTPKQTVAGVFSLWHLSDKQVNVTIVPVNGAELPSDDILSAKLNDIFKKASVTFNVTVDNNLGVTKSQVAVGDSGVLSNYTDDMKDIVTTYKKIRGKTDPKSYYVFVLGKNTRPSRSVAGFMPLKRQFGFVFASNLSSTEEGKTSLEGTLAHELGHGVFALEHPFKQLNTTKGETDWLSDYGNGTKFSHMDWLQMHNPSFKLYWFQDDLEGALTISAVTPNGFRITYKGEGAIVFTDEIPEHSNGAVFAIQHEGKLYEWVDTVNSYMHREEVLELAEDDLPSGNEFIQLYWNKGNCNDNEIYQTTWTDFYNNHIIPSTNPYTSEIRLNLNVDKNSLPEGINFVGLAVCPTDESCGNFNLVELKPEIDALIEISDAINNNINTAVISGLVKGVNDLNICGLKQLKYEVVKTLLFKLMSQQNFDDKNRTERAIVKLMQLIPEDKNADFYNVIAPNGNEKILNNLLAKMKNEPFSGFTEDGSDSTFITSFASIVSGLSSDDKWKVFNLIVKQKYESLEGFTVLALQIIIASQEIQDDEQQNKIPAILGLFIDMLKDPNLPRLKEYKIVFDIAKLRFDKKQKFAKFTMTDFITLRMRDLNDVLLQPEAEQLYGLELLPDSNKSWIFPFPIERFGVLLPKVDAQDLYDNFAWSKHLQNTQYTLEQLDQDPKTFLETFYEQLLIHIDDRNQGNQDFWRTISAISCDNIIDIITHINLNENSASLQEVGESIKKQVLRAYFDCDYTIRIDNRTQLVEGAENSLMKIVASFSLNDQSILETIENIGFEKIDRMLSDTAFHEFIVWLGMQILSSNSGLPMKTIEGVIKIENDDVIIVDPDPLLQLEADIFQRQNFSGDITAENEIEIKNKKYPYNQIVPIHIRGSFSFLGKTYKRGDVLFIPVIQAYAMSESNQSIVVWNTAFLAVDVISFAAPFVGGSIRLFRVSGHLVSKAIMASDIAASGASALVTALNADAINPDLRFKIQMASLATSVPSLFNKLPDDLDDLLRQANRGIDAARISDPDRIILKSSYGGGNLTQIPGVPDDLARAFNADFPNLNRTDLDNDFFDAWITYRRNTNNLTEKMCN